MINLNADVSTLTKKSVMAAIIIVALAAGNIYFAIKCVSNDRKYQIAQERLDVSQYNKKIIYFLDLFIAKVLKSETEVSFDDRLLLENTVRDLDDPEVLAQWERFTGSSSEEQVQKEVKNLLELLVKKINR